MQIHELNDFNGTLGSNAFLAIDSGSDTGKISSQQLLAPTEARIDNIIAGEAPSAAEVTDARLGADGVIYTSLGTAIRTQVSDLKADLSESTRNLNNVKWGRFGSASDGKIYSRTDVYYGMSDYVPIVAGKNYTVSNSGLVSNNAIKLMYMFVDNSKTVLARQQYANNNTRTITAPTGATKLHIHYSSDTTITYSENTHIQIEEGSIQTQFIPSTTATDYALREKEQKKTMVLMDKVGAILDVAKGYFETAYNFVVGQESSLTYQSGRGLFHLNVYDDHNNPTIVCSEFVWALIKGIKYNQSRYVLPLNHMAEWGYTSDGVEDHIEDDEYYAPSYYNYMNDYVEYDANDIPSYDYMVASQTYRYAKNRGWAFEIDSIRQQLRPGDIVFNVDEQSPMYKGITHCAIVVNVGYDDGRCVVLESNDWQYDEYPVGVLLRNAAISSFKYGARFPIYDAPSVVVPCFKENNITIASTDSYSFWTKTDAVYYGSGFYTLVLHGNISENVVQCSLRYEDESISRFFRLVKSADTYTTTFYAIKPFNYVALACETGATVSISDVALYKGYICGDGGVFGFED